MRQRASIVLIHYPEILLLHRFNHGKEYYCLPGGGIDDGETAEQAAIREMKEETNLAVKIDKKLWVYDNPEVKNTEHIFLATEYSGEPAILGHDLIRQSKENNYEIEWVSLYELRNTELLPKEIKEKIIQSFVMEFRWDKLVRDNLPI